MTDSLARNKRQLVVAAITERRVRGTERRKGSHAFLAGFSNLEPRVLRRWSIQLHTHTCHTRCNKLIEENATTTRQVVFDLRTKLLTKSRSTRERNWGDKSTAEPSPPAIQHDQRSVPPLPGVSQCYFWASPAHLASYVTWLTTSGTSTAKRGFSPRAGVCCSVPAVSSSCERGGSANIETKRITSGTVGSERNAFRIRARGL